MTTPTLLGMYLFSAIAWIPYTVLLFYLFCEHYFRARNMQSNILFLLACGAVFRCIWFWVSYYYIESMYIPNAIFNRLAILLQFAALSILMLMWSRAVTISNLTDQEVKQQNILPPNGPSSSSRTDLETGETADGVASQISTAPSSGMTTGAVNLTRSATVSQRMMEERAQRVKKYRELNDKVMKKLLIENRFRGYITGAMVVNVLVWGFVLGTVGYGGNYWYNVNIIAISMACLFAAVVILVVGLRVSVTLQIALSPVYVSSRGSHAYPVVSDDHESTSANSSSKLNGSVSMLSIVRSICCSVQDCVLGCFCCCLCGCIDDRNMRRRKQERARTRDVYGAEIEFLLGCCGLCDLYRFIFRYNQATDANRQGLQMQREVLKVILSVTSITFFFFLIRSLCFLYRPILIDQDASDTDLSTDRSLIGNVTYPFFFYEVPELIPNLAIALGISPPAGILRKAYRVLVEKIRMSQYWLMRVLLTVCGVSSGAGGADGGAGATTGNRNGGGSDGRRGQLEPPSLQSHQEQPSLYSEDARPANSSIWNASDSGSNMGINSSVRYTNSDNNTNLVADALTEKALREQQQQLEQQATAITTTTRKSKDGEGKSNAFEGDSNAVFSPLSSSSTPPPPQQQQQQPKQQPGTSGGGGGNTSAMAQKEEEEVQVQVQVQVDEGLGRPSYSHSQSNSTSSGVRAAAFSMAQSSSSQPPSSGGSGSGNLSSWLRGSTGSGSMSNNKDSGSYNSDTFRRSRSGGGSRRAAGKVGLGSRSRRSGGGGGSNSNSNSGTGGGEEEEDEEDVEYSQWMAVRQESEEIADIIYRINSYSSEEFSSRSNSRNSSSAAAADATTEGSWWWMQQQQQQQQQRLNSSSGHVMNAIAEGNDENEGADDTSSAAAAAEEVAAGRSKNSYWSKWKIW